MDTLEGGPGFGEKPLRDEWEGCYGVHIGPRDRYRVIWEPQEPEAAYDGDEEVEEVVMLVLRVGAKRNAKGQTIYEEGRPESG